MIPQSNHEPLCLEGLTAQEMQYVLSSIEPERCEICDLIRRARSEERSSMTPPYMSAEWHAGYQQAKEDIIKSIQKMLWPFGASKDYVISYIRK